KRGWEGGGGGGRWRGTPGRTCRPAGFLGSLVLPLGSSGEGRRRQPRPTGSSPEGNFLSRLVSLGQLLRLQRAELDKVNATSADPNAPPFRMSQLSSTLKRYDSPRYSDTSYNKSTPGYGTYSAYSSNLSSSYPDKEKIGYKSSATSSYLTSSHLRLSGAHSSSSNYDGGGRLLQRPDSGTRLSPTYGRVPLRPPGSGGLSGGGLSGGTSYSYGNAASTSYSTPLGRKKSSSHSDLARDLSSMHLSSDPYRTDSSTRGHFLARTRQELSTLQGIYQSARRSDYVKDYLESCSRKGGRSPVPSLHNTVPEVITPTLRATSRCSIQQWDRTDSRTDILAKEASVSFSLGVRSGWSQGVLRGLWPSSVEPLGYRDCGAEPGQD
ncbi:hypothetical protein lerEdw1_013467, partial [Lerista edwardsae]